MNYIVFLIFTGSILLNDVFREKDVVTGVSLLERGPAWAVFKCFTLTEPLSTQYSFNRYLSSNISTQMKIGNGNWRKISDPIFSSDSNYFIVDVQAKCSFALISKNAYLDLEGTILKDGETSNDMSDMFYDKIITYESGYAKSRFILSKKKLENVYLIPSFTLTIHELDNEKPLTSHMHTLFIEKALDGTSPAVPRGNVAISFRLPEEDGTINISRGSNRRIVCEAYGNPKPIIKWKKEGHVIKTQRDNSAYNWHKLYDYRSMNDSDGGHYIGEARVLGKTVSKSVDVNVCDPAIINFSTIKDDHFINVTLKANQDDTNRVIFNYCFRTKRANTLGWIREFDSQVKVYIKESNTSWVHTYSWKIVDKEEVPREMNCVTLTNCGEHYMIIIKMSSRNYGIIGCLSLKEE